MKLDFEYVFKSQFTVLCNVAFNITNNKKAAEDIVQDVFLKLWQNKKRFNEADNYKGYLYRATANGSIDYLKQNKNSIPFTFIQNDIRHAGSSGEKLVVERELEVRIEKAMANLPPKCRAIFVLSRFEGMKFREIAEHLQISLKTVENQMGIALGKLRLELRSYLTREFSVKPDNNVELK